MTAIEFTSIELANEAIAKLREDYAALDQISDTYAERLGATMAQLTQASRTALEFSQQSEALTKKNDNLARDHKNHLDNQRVHAEILIGLIRMVKGFQGEYEDDTRGQLELLEEFVRQHLTPFNDYSDIPF